MVENDVTQACAHMNLSHWSDYTRAALLSKIGAMLKTSAMSSGALHGAASGGRSVRLRAARSVGVGQEPKTCLGAPATERKNAPGSRCLNTLAGILIRGSN